MSRHARTGTSGLRIAAPRPRRAAPTMNIGLFLTMLLLGLSVVASCGATIPTAPAGPSTDAVPALPVSVAGEVTP